MFDFLKNLTGAMPNLSLTPEQAAQLLKTTPDALRAFEESYRVNALEKPNKGDMFDTSVKQANAQLSYATPSEYDAAALNNVCDRIVDELLALTQVWEFDGQTAKLIGRHTALGDGHMPVTKEELERFPLEVRPMLSGTLTMTDIDADTGLTLLHLYKSFMEERNPKKKTMLYHQFRQGLDILDLDALAYAMLGTNPNNISHWLPAVAETAASQGFFKVPATTVIQVPLTLLQLTRLDYGRINQTTRDIINKYCMRVFRLNVDNDYFVKTGTYSSKFDFRNAHVTAGKEVTELGEYLVYISSRAVEIAGPLVQPSIYGMSTTNEWAVREYIPDAGEDKLTIYKGMPLRPEYRVFVDFDTAEVIGVNPYWDAKLMEKRFAEGAIGGNDHDKHDYVVYLAAKESLYAQYNRNVDVVKAAIEALAQAVHDAGTLSGQWSVDVMQNGDNFYLIDMAWAQNSAMYDCVPKEKRLPMQEDWLPAIGG